MIGTERKKICKCYQNFGHREIQNNVSIYSVSLSTIALGIPKGHKLFHTILEKKYHSSLVCCRLSAQVYSGFIYWKEWCNLHTISAIWCYHSTNSSHPDFGNCLSGRLSVPSFNTFITQRLAVCSNWRTPGKKKHVCLSKNMQGISGS